MIRIKIKASLSSNELSSLRLYIVLRNEFRQPLILYWVNGVVVHSVTLRILNVFYTRITSNNSDLINKTKFKSSPNFSFAISAESIIVCTWRPHATIVTSPPFLTISASLRGIFQSPSGTKSEEARYNRFGSKYMTGLSSSMLDNKRPLACRGPLGITT